MVTIFSLVWGCVVWGGRSRLGRVSADWSLASAAGRELLLEVVGALEAVVVALQVARAGTDPTLAIEEAVRRVARARRRVEGERSAG